MMWEQLNDRWTRKNVAVVLAMADQLENEHGTPLPERLKPSDVDSILTTVFGMPLKARRRNATNA